MRTLYGKEIKIMNQDEILHIETDDSCAICGLKGSNILTIHHIDHNRGNNAYDNKIILCHNCHQKHNINEEFLSNDEIQNRKRHLIVKTLTTHGLNILKKAYRSQFSVLALKAQVFHLIELGYLKESELPLHKIGDGSGSLSEFDITEDGKLLIEKWFV